ncbi:hypothetical protein D3C83_45410 [compost metagenome]
MGEEIADEREEAGVAGLGQRDPGRPAQRDNAKEPDAGAQRQLELARRDQEKKQRNC